MYDCDCPYCNKTNTFFEVDNCINRYVPRMCEHCGKIFYNLQRSWFDPFYDNMNVEIQKQEWMDEKIKEKQVEDVGNMKNEAGEIVAHIYAPLFDIYEKNGGREHVEKVVKKMLNNSSLRIPMEKRSIRCIIDKKAEEKAEEKAKQVDLAYIEFFVEEFNKKYKTKLRIITE